MHTYQASSHLTQRSDRPRHLRRLFQFIDRHNPIFVLTGAGCSTDSGIPDYRDANGTWKHQKPVQYQEFIRNHSTRQRYWARSMQGWPTIAEAIPNRAHRGLVEMERKGIVAGMVTQNVDGLHHKAGQRNVIELHGNVSTVRCLSCSQRYDRSDIQGKLSRLNPAFTDLKADIAPDGDAALEQADVSAFSVIECGECAGILKPDVVFFGESVPRPRVEAAFSLLRQSRGMLIVGSSLTVYSGYRFCRFAADNNIPVAAINLGRTRADQELTVKVEMNCAQALSELDRYFS